MRTFIVLLRDAFVIMFFGAVFMVALYVMWAIAQAPGL